jgi:nicotinic acid mononucleotide adenylyltransferase
MSAGLERRLPSKAIRRNREVEAVVQTIHCWTDGQLQGIGRKAADQGFSDRLRSIAAYIDACLLTISQLADSDRIRPFQKIAAEEDDRPIPAEGPALRVGFYPIAANPLHWGHILVGLTVMASMSLDKVVFLIAGEDRRKPGMPAAQLRHKLGRSVLETFHPLFAYSSLALGTDLDGETNFGRMLSLNSRQRMEAFYIAGADHYRRTTSAGEPDTLQKLEWIVDERAKAGCGLHTISAVFLDRDGVDARRQKAATSLKVRVLPPLPFSFSSTAARNALSEEELPDEGFSEALASLPYSYFLEIRESRLYSGRLP